MVELGRRCEHWYFLLVNCNRSQEWRENRYCQKSCDAGGIGESYGTDPPCCFGDQSKSLNQTICELSELTVVSSTPAYRTVACAHSLLWQVPRRVYFSNLDVSVSFVFSVILFGIVLLAYTVSAFFTLSKDTHDLLAETGTDSMTALLMVQTSNLLTEIQTLIEPIRERWTSETLQANSNHKVPRELAAHHQTSLLQAMEYMKIAEEGRSACFLFFLESR